MYIILWEFEVATLRATEFRSVYSPQGEWAQLFALSPGYRGTELLQSSEAATRFVTIDRWTSEEDFESFQREFGASYAALDLRCRSLSLAQRKMGAFVDAAGQQGS
jgi:heme-degrading monooxygenase HmoA